ncbi:MAG: helix-turn-helix transcriptional regulator, partial [Bacteroidota bacterium]|nr:helix-turn-helix transcriptional regulator [Bacteroidota bacterium]
MSFLQKSEAAMNIYITSNIRLLRKRRKRTQEDVAFAVNMNRATYCGIELGKSMPGIETLVALSNYFRISIDTLIRVDLAKLSEFQLSELERGNDAFIKASNLRILASTHNSDNKENIEL